LWIDERKDPQRIVATKPVLDLAQARIDELRGIRPIMEV